MYGYIRNRVLLHFTLLGYYRIITIHIYSILRLCCLGSYTIRAANLVCATTAVKSNMGLSFLAYSSLPIMLGWSCWWLVSFVSTIYVTSGCDGQGNCSSEPPGILVFALLLSYHWTFQVIKNVIHVTVAGGLYHRRAHRSVHMVYEIHLFGR